MLFDGQQQILSNGYVDQFRMSNQMYNQWGIQSNTAKQALCPDINISLRDHPHITHRSLTKHRCTVPNCAKSFKTESNRDRHVRFHFKTRPFVCPVCPKSFTQNGNLKKHLLSHSEPNLDTRRVHECSVCGKKYTEKYTLKTHERKFHPAEYARKYGYRGITNLY
ncbi:unnamed protein product [Moneuplotes crassus]|uniref:C2H2-type domain-containing protein n=1 Tax=Euplotes crassus TaxID=5936 RepID=A0AAD1XLY6_EUPCR|nr:unnamed protein product [Moneuplotes crassus]